MLSMPTDTTSIRYTSTRQQGLAVARIARDDGNSSINRSSDGYDELPTVKQLCILYGTEHGWVSSLTEPYLC